jgi:iron complex outermembrane receptor protein
MKYKANFPYRGTGVVMVIGALTCTSAFAQFADSTVLQRVEVTGSAIKRIEGEAALPVQVITRAEIVKAGLTTAAEIVAKVSANSNGLSDGGSLQSGGYHDQTGFNSANLRGLGTSSTLVLLNGRRMANFASPGDDSGVDLNNIPAAAIQRVEVLLDGASAIYGSDAIGGVINFITRDDFQGLEVSAYAGTTQEGGAGKRTSSIAAGTGDLTKDGFNLMGVLDLQQTDALSTSQRKFISDLQVPLNLPHLLSSATFPGNIRLGRDQFNYLADKGFSTNGKTVIDSRTINLSAPGCNPPASLYLPLGIGGADGCTYDYMRDVELYPRSDKLAAMGRGTFRLDAQHQLFAEASYSKSKTYYVSTSNRVDGDLDVSLIPALARTGLADALPDDRIITVRTRLLEAGRRMSELSSTGERYLLGMKGTVGSWDYDTAYNHSVNTVSDRDVHGYLLYDKLMQGIASGVVNVFGDSSSAGKQYLDSIQVNEDVRYSRGTMDALDVKASRELTKLKGGPLAIALGAEVRRERVIFVPSPLLVSDNIQGDSSPGEGQGSDNGRNAASAYAELRAPLTKELELQLALRNDWYEGVGSTTNPKIGVRFQPRTQFLLRASAGTGFRAPSLSDLYRPTVSGITSTLADPVCLAENGSDLSYCADNYSTQRYSNPDLKPERSRQFSIGAVIEPSKRWSFSADYWMIQKTDLISEIGDDVILANPDKYGSLVHRRNKDEGFCSYDPSDSSICFIELRRENRGQQQASGIDFVAEMRGVNTDLGTIGAKFTGTLALVSEQQTGNGDPFVSNLGKFVTDGVVQRWRHRISLDWSKGPWSANLANTYLSGYDDQNSAIDTNSGTMVAATRVPAYSIWDTSVTLDFNKSLRIRGGVQNLFDTPPPFSNQSYFFLSGYDPSYTDPRGRFYYLSAQYAFK